MVEVFEWKCPECSRVIHSTYKEQFEYNKEQHIKAHKRNNSSNISSVGGGSNPNCSEKVNDKEGDTLGTKNP